MVANPWPPVPFNTSRIQQQPSDIRLFLGKVEGAVVRGYSDSWEGMDIGRLPYGCRMRTFSLYHALWIKATHILNPKLKGAHLIAILFCILYTLASPVRSRTL
jgi:hypothetical protein